MCRPASGCELAKSAPPNSRGRDRRDDRPRIAIILRLEPSMLCPYTRLLQSACLSTCLSSPGTCPSHLAGTGGRRTMKEDRRVACCRPKCLPRRELLPSLTHELGPTTTLCVEVICWSCAFSSSRLCRLVIAHICNDSVIHMSLSVEAVQDDPWAKRCANDK